MNISQLHQLHHRLNSISIFRHLLDHPVISSLNRLIASTEDAGSNDTDKQLSCYGAFAESVFSRGGDLSRIVRQIVLDDENFYVVGRARGQEMADCIDACLDRELELMQEISQISSQDVRSLLAEYDGYLPDWITSPVDIRSDYTDMLSHLSSTGYGIFAKYNGFTVKDGKLCPITSLDSQTLDTLYGYERERNMVLQNTRCLMEGGQACNVLLYGDAGTGKSSTIKAVARHFYDQGLRLVEFNKDQLDDIVPIMEYLSDIPLKFIFYIDDLSFSQNDDTFCALKGILEGSAASYAGNIVIYATSNRRHLIKESMEDRVGSQLHVNDTLQETMSLAARFGLTITFSKPEKGLYLEIVKSMAKEQHVDMPEEELFKRAEAFAIRQSGRSPRTARQFIQTLKIGL